MQDYEDAILPEGFVPPQTEAEPVDTQETVLEGELETVAEDTKPADESVEPQEPTTQPQKLKVKFNHQEMELDADEAAALAQKGLNYEKAIERAKQEAAQEASQKARDAVIAEMGYVDYEGKPITTEARYREVLQEKEIREKYADLPDELRQELIASRRDREERKAKEQQQAEEQQKLAVWNEFFQVFKETNDRDFDMDKDKLPPEVEEAIAKGSSPTAAYLRYHAKELRNKLKIQQQNQENTKKAPVGSVTAGGGSKAESEDPFLVGFNSDY